MPFNKEMLNGKSGMTFQGGLLPSNLFANGFTHTQGNISFSIIL